MGSQSVMDGLARTQDEEPFGSLEDKDPLAAKYITVRVWFVVSKLSVQARVSYAGLAYGRAGEVD